METADVAASKRRKRHHHHPAHDTKLPRLPPDATVHKRPLLRPSLPSPHANAAVPKIVYVATNTPFLSAVKRTEKLLRLSDQRLVQSATRVARNNTRKRRIRHARHDDGHDDDDLEAVARVAEEQKHTSGEEVMIKATGKAISKVLEIALWFQQREHEYRVRLQTGSASSIDDIEYREGGLPGEGVGDITEETRIRKVSVIEVYVCLR